MSKPVSHLLGRRDLKNNFERGWFELMTTVHFLPRSAWMQAYFKFMILGGVNYTRIVTRDEVQLRAVDCLYWSNNWSGKLAKFLFGLMGK